MNCIGVVGAGVMGVGVAQNLAETGHNVVLLDVSEEVLQKAQTQIRQNIRLSRMLGQSDRKTPIGQTLDRIHLTTKYDPFKNVEFVVENVVEKWDIKQDVYARLDAVCQPETIYAANTSAISITKIGSATDRADRVVGMHFMNPVPMKPTVEVIRGYHTSKETIATAQSFLHGMGKKGIVVNDSPGFVSNRVLMLTVNEAIYLVQDQVASPAEIDEIFVSCFGHTMGPLATADLIGLDTILYSVDVLYESYNDSKYRPCPLLKKMVDAGLHGRKSGEGFFKY